MALTAAPEQERSVAARSDDFVEALPAAPRLKASSSLSLSTLQKENAPTQQGVNRTTTLQKLILANPLADAIQQLRKRRVLLHFHAQMPHTRVVQ